MSKKESLSKDPNKSEIQSKFFDDEQKAALEANKKQTCFQAFKSKFSGNKNNKVATDNEVIEDVDYNALDINAAVDYALDANKKE